MKLFFMTIAVLLLPHLATAQDTIVLGTMNTKDEHPFGTTPSGTAAYLGEYQQVYASSAFSSPIVITQVAFASYFSYGGTADYSFSISLGTTAKSPTSLGTSFETGFSTVFSGSLSPVFTVGGGDFDLLIPLTSPISYNPGQGNLLLDVVVSSATGDNFFLFDAQKGTPDMGTLWSSGGSIVASSDYGLVTEFTITPEPSSWSLIFLGGGVLIYARRGKGHFHL